MRFTLLAAAIAAIAFADEVGDNAEPALIDAGADENASCNYYYNYYSYGSVYYSTYNLCYGQYCLSDSWC